MACKGRFVKVEGGGLPSITNYDYPDTNLYIRGVEDRSFQFQEVCSASNWLFKQQSTDGDFDKTGAWFTGDGEYNLTNRVTTANSYSGWTVGGSIVYDLPFSGAYHGGAFKALAGVTGEFFGAPREGKHSPVFLGTAATEVGIIQTGINLTGDTRHQLYADLQVLYSQTGIHMDFWVEGQTGDATKPENIVAWYNPLTRVWEGSRPENTVAVTNRPTEIAFDFTTSDFPGATPQYYNIRVGLTGTDTLSTNDADAAFVQVDSVYLDMYMKKNAFTDVIVPSGYMLEITPDLGWHDTLSMFGDREGSPNPHLVTLGPYSLASGLVDNLDSSVTVSVADTEMARAISDNYRKYLWRALALSENGVLGAGGFPRRFTYLGKIFEEEFSVDQVWDDPMSITKLITGTKSRRMTILVNGLADDQGLEYLTDTSWKLTIVMDAPKKEIFIQGKDKGGAKTSERFLTLTSDAIGLAEKALWNVFDEYGLLMGVERLPDEPNETYAERIRDAFQAPGSHFFGGVVDGGTRELGLHRIADALLVTHKSRDGITRPQPIEIEVQASAVLVRTVDMSITETVMVDPVMLTCDLSEYVADDPALIETIEGIRVNLDQVTIFDENSERPDFRKIQFKDDTLGGKLVKVTYDYFREYTFTDYPTLGTLVQAIRGFTNLLGVSVLRADVGKTIAGHESSHGLYIAHGIIQPSETLGLSWSPVYLKRVGDRVYRESFRNADSTLWNTRFYRWVQELKSNTNTEWGHVIADKAVWDAADNTLDGYDHVPTITDPSVIGYSTTGGRSIDAEEAHGRGFEDEDGKTIVSSILVSDDFLPGVAHTHDLQPTVYATLSSSPEIAEEVDVIVGETGNPPLIFFSGTIN